MFLGLQIFAFRGPPLNAKLDLGHFEMNFKILRGFFYYYFLGPVLFDGPPKPHLCAVFALRQDIIRFMLYITEIWTGFSPGYFGQKRDFTVLS